MKTILALLITFSFFSCGNSAEEKKSSNPDYNSSLEKVEKGMNMDDVDKIAGRPSRMEDLGVSQTDTKATHIVQWYYGNNQSVMFENEIVVGVDLDIEATQKKFQHMRDSVEALGGNTGGMIQPQ